MPVYLQFNQPKLVHGSINEKQVIDSLFNCACIVGNQADCTDDAINAYMSTTALCMDFLEISEKYALSARLYDNIDEALCWLSDVESETDEEDDVYYGTVDIYSNNFGLRCDSTLMYLGLSSSKQKESETDEEDLDNVDWNVYCCLVVQY